MDHRKIVPVIVVAIMSLCLMLGSCNFLRRTNSSEGGDSILISVLVYPTAGLDDSVYIESVRVLGV